MSLKNPVTRPGIEPGTGRLVAQRLKHYATPGPSLLDTYRYLKGTLTFGEGNFHKDTFFIVG
jgi:hypothetical protein